MHIPFPSLFATLCLLAACGSPARGQAAGRPPADAGHATTSVTATGNATEDNQPTDSAAATDGKDYRISAPQDEQNPSPLEAILLTTTQYAIQDIYFLSPPQIPPTLLTTGTIYEGQSILVVPVLRRYAISDEGKVDIRYRPTAILPDGQIEDEVGEVTFYKGKAPPQGVLLFSNEALSGFYTGKDQKPGSYTLKVDLHDQISGARQTLEKKITVIPYEIPSLPEGFNPGNWIHYYHTKPEPELALPVLLALMEEIDANRIHTVSGSMLGFYNQVLIDNPWLLPHFSKRLEEALDRVNSGDTPTSADIMLGLVLSFHLRQMEERPEQISERIWLETESNRQFDWSYIDVGSSRFVHYPQQLDYQWGKFFASGSFAPVYRLIEVLFQDKKAAAEAAPQFIRNLEPEQQQALGEAIHRATEWSLTSNALRHRLVRAYLLGIAFNEKSDLSAENRKHLQILFTTIIETLKQNMEESQQQEDSQEQSKPLEQQIE